MPSKKLKMAPVKKGWEPLVYTM